MATTHTPARQRTERQRLYATTLAAINGYLRCPDEHDAASKYIERLTKKAFEAGYAASAETSTRKRWPRCSSSRTHYGCLLPDVPG